jgi:ribosomal protein S18 acetylase RimI-like enzyme
MTFNIRQATEEDLTLTYKIKKNALQEYLEMLWGWNDISQREFHQEEYKKEHFQVIELQNEAIGYLETIPFDDHIFLANLMILKQFQGQGIGKIIMEDLIRNYPNIHLEVLKVNHRAVEFYQDLGFTIFEEMEDSLRMRLSESVKK